MLRWRRPGWAFVLRMLTPVAPGALLLDASSVLHGPAGSVGVLTVGNAVLLAVVVSGWRHGLGAMAVVLVGAIAMCIERGTA